MDEMRNYEYEEEINLKQLLVYVLRKWRSMLAAAVILGLLLGGVKMAKGFLDFQDPEKVEESVKEAELAQENYDTARSQLTNQMAEYNRQIDDYRKYQENSLYMKIDPYAVYKESVTYVVTTDYQILPNMTYQTLNWMGPVLSAYTSVATSVTLKDLPPEGQAGLSEEWDADSLDKLIRVETNTNDGKLTITASAESKIRAKAILQAVRAKVETNKDSIAKAAGEHKLSVIAEKSMITVDQTIINDREARLRNVTALREAADKAVEKYNKLSAPKDTSLTEKGIIKRGIKFAVLGGVAGLLLSCFFFCVLFMINGKLNDVSGLKERYHTRVFAMLPENKKACLIDNMLNCIEGSVSKQTAETLLLVAGAEIDGQQNGKRIAIAGTVSDGTKKMIAETLQQSGDVTVFSVGNVLSDPEAVRKIKSADSVILVEAKYASAMSDIDREKELLDSMKVSLAGFIIV